MNIETIVSMVTIYFTAAMITFYIKVISIDTDVPFQEIVATAIFWPVVLLYYLIFGLIMVIKRQIKDMKEDK